ncbi:MAG: AEC family transporter, partial [Oscillospiraceae bacterium]|nr:AEC family transporter [Oscillospiraceae bacterium]
LPLALFSVPIPHVLGQGIGFLADLNVPLAMIIIGSNMACSKLTDAVRDLRAITASAARLLLVPLALFAALYFVPIPSIIKAAILISTCSPVAASCTLMASRCGVNTSLADKCVTLSTLLSIVTMPLVQFVVRNA